MEVEELEVMGGGRGVGCCSGGIWVVEMVDVVVGDVGEEIRPPEMGALAGDGGRRWLAVMAGWGWPLLEEKKKKKKRMKEKKGKRKEKEKERRERV